jgi:hypothetical protein
MAIVQTASIILLNLMVMGDRAQALTAPVHAAVTNEQAIAQVQDYSPPNKGGPSRSGGSGARYTGVQQ